MKPSELVSLVHEMGIRVVLTSNGVKLVADSGDIPQSAIDLARSMKSELLDYLRSDPNHFEVPGFACDYCGSNELYCFEHKGYVRCLKCERVAYWFNDQQLDSPSEILNWIEWDAPLDIDYSLIGKRWQRVNQVETKPSPRPQTVPPVKCKTCGSAMIPAKPVVNGWQNWDCPSCKAVIPVCGVAK